MKNVKKDYLVVYDNAGEPTTLVFGRGNNRVVNKGDIISLYSAEASCYPKWLQLVDEKTMEFLENIKLKKEERDIKEAQMKIDDIKEARKERTIVKEEVKTVDEPKPVIEKIVEEVVEEPVIEEVVEEPKPTKKRKAKTKKQTAKK